MLFLKTFVIYKSKNIVQQIICLVFFLILINIHHQLFTKLKFLNNTETKTLLCKHSLRLKKKRINWTIK